MKEIITTLVTMLSLTAFTAQARTPAQNDALYTAQSLVGTLEDVQDLAANLAGKAQRRGNYSDAHALSNLVDSAEALAQKLVRNVVQPLIAGKSLSVVKAQLSRIQSNFSLLQSDVYEIDYLPYDLADLLDEVDYLKYDLKNILAAGDRGRDDRPTR